MPSPTLRLVGRAFLVALSVASLTAGGLSSQTPMLLRDVNALPPSPVLSSWPERFSYFGGALYFGAEHPQHGRELFRSDGTAAGTGLFHEFTPGTAGSEIGRLVPVGNQAFFVASSPAAGTELWVTDGTTTRMVIDLSPGLNRGAYGSMAPFGGNLLFAGRDPAHGTELWLTDGTAAGTRMVIDLRAGLTGSSPHDLQEIGGRMVFAAGTDQNGVELLVTDGTAAGTQLLADPRAGVTDSGPRFVGRVNGKLLYRLTGWSDRLMLTDGTPPGTTVLTNVALVGESFADLGGLGVFTASEGRFGRELWVTDGTVSGTQLLMDLVVGAESSDPFVLGTAGTRALFAVDRGQGELWSTDGTVAGTLLLRSLDVYPGPGSESVRGLVFRADDGVAGVEPWVSDGTLAGTALLRDIQPGPADSSPSGFTAFSALVAFGAEDDKGVEPWITDGSTAGTQRLADVADYPPQNTASSNPISGVDWHGSLLFLAEGGRTASWGGAVAEPFASDGTAAGTGLYHRFPGDNPFTSLSYGRENPRLHVYGGMLSLIVDDFPYVVWSDVGNGPVAGSPIDLDGHDPLTDYAYAGGYAWLKSYKLFRVRGGVVAEALDQCWGRFARMGTWMMASAIDQGQDGLFRCDGTGCTLVAATSQGDVAVVGTRAFYSARDPGNQLDQELGVWDGATNTAVVLDVVPGASSIHPQALERFGDGVIFTGDDGVNGRQVWVSDGTLAGTRSISSFSSSGALWNVRFLPVGADRMLFVGSEPSLGTEVWVADHSGVRLLADLEPGPGSSRPRLLGVVGEEAWFSTDSPPAVWRTDGSTAGTTQVITGSAYWMTVVAGKVYFDHDDGVHGREPWVVSAGATAKTLGEGCGVGPRTPWLAASDPVLGRAWTFSGGGGPTGSIGLAVLGVPAVWPTRLAGHCVDYLRPASLSVVKSTSRADLAWQQSTALPNDPALNGLQLGLQYWVGPSSNPLGVESSPMVWLSLGAW